MCSPFPWNFFHPSRTSSSAAPIQHVFVPSNLQTGSKPKTSKNRNQVVHTSLFCSHSKGRVVNILANDLLEIALRKNNAINKANLIAFFTPALNASTIIIIKYGAKGNHVKHLYEDQKDLSPSY